MAVTNFRASDFPKGKKAKEQHNEPRKDNKILDDELDNAVRDPKEGAKFAKDFAKKDAEAEKTLADEVKNAVPEGTNEEQTKATPKKRGSKASE